MKKEKKIAEWLIRSTAEEKDKRDSHYEIESLEMCICAFFPPLHLMPTRVFFLYP